MTKEALQMAWEALVAVRTIVKCRNQRAYDQLEHAISMIDVALTTNVTFSKDETLNYEIKDVLTRARMSANWQRAENKVSQALLLEQLCDVLEKTALKHKLT